MAEYLILIYQEEKNPPVEVGSDVRAATLAEHGRFQQQAVEMGAKLLGGNALTGATTATSIRGDVVTDGPFVDTKEVLGGYYLVDARDLDHALAVARLCPAPTGGVEVRPILDTSAG